MSGTEALGPQEGDAPQLDAEPSELVLLQQELAKFSLEQPSQVPQSLPARNALPLRAHSVDLGTLPGRPSGRGPHAHEYSRAGASNSRPRNPGSFQGRVPPVSSFPRSPESIKTVMLRLPASQSGKNAGD